MKLRPLTLSLATLLLTPSLQAQEQTSSSLWSMIQQGGWAMYPLAACSLALFYIAIHCYRETRPKNFSPPNLVQQLSQNFSAADIPASQKIARSSDTLLGRSLTAAFPKLNTREPANDLEAFETEIGAALSSEENAIAQWTHYLSVVANVAPMIGLLGTVSGMIGGFQTMATGGMGRPELFAGDIGEALITTATGLCIGIPAMIAHSVFNNRLQNAITETTRQANNLIDQLPQKETSHLAHHL
ncbi:MotA/TolQ/ExbB proton channel family protein [Pelagicoccus sp. SDUM812002]|uniref:MotA/TolQ/ExbB proton channel family protein n=1 Tax=Pelagicoccus sp. SDUM812002 TaxID=3041266 RepID=UPI00280E12E3|nr:MotA/TolQ/ExbB proton channel family protein [Pelagicoccus sp. SDUM812002]MDQ8184968.1 MotA/TolQ/ExbB proton channel family protein [Pelagicoccus sp. SDUM812002]